MTTPTGGDERSFLSCLRQDYQRLHPTTAFSVGRFLVSSLGQPGLLACMVLRLQELAMRRGRVRAAQLLRTSGLVLTGADFVPGCTAGPGLLMHHPNGIVFGGGSTLGVGCTVLQQVTLGVRHAHEPAHHEYPRVGDGVTIGAGARVLGGITIGSQAVIGANAVVLHDVPPAATAAGVPARILSAPPRS